MHEGKLSVQIQTQIPPTQQHLRLILYFLIILIFLPSPVLLPIGQSDSQLSC